MLKKTFVVAAYTAGAMVLTLIGTSCSCICSTSQAEQANLNELATSYYRAQFTDNVDMMWQMVSCNSRAELCKNRSEAEAKDYLWGEFKKQNTAEVLAKIKQIIEKQGESIIYNYTLVVLEDGLIKKDCKWYIDLAAVEAARAAKRVNTIDHSSKELLMEGYLKAIDSNSKMQVWDALSPEIRIAVIEKFGSKAAALDAVFKAATAQVNADSRKKIKAILAAPAAQKSKLIAQAIDDFEKSGASIILYGDSWFITADK